jgi:hypothetical protein
MKRWSVFAGAMFLFLVTPSAAPAQFLRSVGGGGQHGVQDDPGREQRALERDKLKLQNAEQRRHLREEEFQAEVRQWTATVQAWREMSGQPPLSENQIDRRLDQLRVFDWERQYQEKWINK